MKASDVTIYAVGFLQHQTSLSALAQRRRLREITEVTGGRAFFPSGARDIAEA